jgi:hypothetical protein
VHFCLQNYTLFTLLLPLHIIYFSHLLSTNHKCTQPCYFSLLLKPAAQKEKVDWNSSTRSFRLRVASVAIPVVLWSLPLFRFTESRLSLQRHYLCNNYTLYYDIWLSVSTFGRMCGTIDPGSCIRLVLGFGIKTGYDRSGTRAVSIVGTLA